MAKTPPINLTSVLESNQSQFLKAYGEATAYAQLSWQISEAAKDIDNLPTLPVILSWQIHDGQQVVDFARSRYRHISWYYTLMKICTAAEEYFLAPCMVFEWVRQSKNGQISYQQLQNSQDGLHATNEHYWRKFKRDCGIKVELGPYMDSILKIRNCIAHRGGVVGQRDIDQQSKKLDVKWLDYYVSFEGQEVTELPFHTKDGGTMTVNRREKALSLSLGQEIEFSLQDILSIHFNVLDVVTQAHNASLKRLTEIVENTWTPDQ